MFEAASCDVVAVTVSGAPLQGSHEGVAVDGGDPDLAQHSARVRNRCRFDEAGCHELEERFVVDDIEAETSPGSSDDLDQPAGAFPGDRRCRAGGAEVEVELLLAGEQFLPRRLEQSGEFAVGVGRSEVLEDLVPATLLGRDLHRGRSRGGADFADIGGHEAESTEPLVCHFPHTHRRYLHRRTGLPRKPPHLVQLGNGEYAGHGAGCQFTRQ